MSKGLRARDRSWQNGSLSGVAEGRRKGGGRMVGDRSEEREGRNAKDVRFSFSNQKEIL